MASFDSAQRSNPTGGTISKERQQALKDYKLTIEYKHLKEHAPGGVFVLPSFEDLRLWHGVIFVRRGYYSNAIFKFRVRLPPAYNDVGTRPEIAFDSRVYSPLVDPETGALGLRCGYPEWNPNKHYMVTVLTFLKKIFYMKAFDYPDPPHPEAQELFNTNKKEFIDRVAACVRESQEKMYEASPGSTVKFTEPKPVHEHMMRSIREGAPQPSEGGDGGGGGAAKVLHQTNHNTNFRENMLESVQQANKIYDDPNNDSSTTSNNPVEERDDKDSAKTNTDDITSSS
eukprot:CAMPEP_0194588468 /NCGR_PEP_ID=MMETSP0292-20121207/19808_1 /TAXON_ID=39354 /ORGANISM="Heterosigma akashiwo, Strain CCMP2393" /LENGTH=284 /DNA_ID=CAMNT_0039444997 /DNA_START=45 /DNA_END=899 /DNA_ORIENTATION=+